MRSRLFAVGLLGVTVLCSACGGSGTDQRPAERAKASPPPVTSTSAGAGEPANDCSIKIDATAAANILGVPKARPNPYHGHSKQPPDNMDVLGCGYSDASPDPTGPTLEYFIYTPKPSDVAIVYGDGAENHPNMQTFATSVGLASAGWVGARPVGGFQAFISFRTAANIFRIRVSGLPSVESAESAVLKVAARM